MPTSVDLTEVRIPLVSYSFSQPVVVCRPALSSDAEDVLEFTKYTLGGHDYIRDVWQDWLADPQGILAVAQYGPHAVAVAKASLVSPGQWWLEGFRVDPNFQGLGMGSHLHDYMDAWWLNHGDGTVGLVTSSERVQVHHLCERTGFTRVAAVKGYEAAALSEPLHAFEGIAPEAVQDARRIMSLHKTSLCEWMDSGWRFTAPDGPALRQTAGHQHLLGWRGREAVFAFWEDVDDGLLGVGLVACAPSVLSELLMDIRRLAAQRGLATVLWHVPAGTDVQAALETAAFTTDWDDSGYVYTKHHPAS